MITKTALPRGQSGAAKADDFEAVHRVPRVVSVIDGAGFGVYCQRLEMTEKEFADTNVDISRELAAVARLRGCNISTSVRYVDGCAEVAVAGYAGEEKFKVEAMVPAIMEMECREHGIRYSGPNVIDKLLKMKAAADMLLREPSAGNQS